MKAEDLHEYFWLVWYDGPMSAVYYDTDRNYYISYDNVLVSTTIQDLILLFDNNMAYADIFKIAKRKWKWDEEQGWLEVDKINDEDLMDPDVYYSDIGRNVSEYVKELSASIDTAPSIGDVTALAYQLGLRKSYNILTDALAQQLIK